MLLGLRPKSLKARVYPKALSQHRRRFSRDWEFSARLTQRTAHTLTEEKEKEIAVFFFPPALRPVSLVVPERVGEKGKLFFLVFSCSFCQTAPGCVLDLAELQRGERSCWGFPTMARGLKKQPQAGVTGFGPRTFGVWGVWRDSSQRLGGRMHINSGQGNRHRN